MPETSIQENIFFSWGGGLWESTGLRRAFKQYQFLTAQPSGSGWMLRIGKALAPNVLWVERFEAAKIGAPFGQSERNPYALVLCM